MHAIRNPVLTAFALTLLASAPAHAGRQALFDGPLHLAGFTHQSVEFHVPGEWMRHPRLQGRIEASGGGGNDIALLILRQEDFPRWEKHESIEPVFDAGRRTVVDLDVALPGPGGYEIVLSNRFSKLSGKDITGHIALIWDEDPSLPEGEGLKAQVHFLNPPKNPDRFAVRVNPEDSTSLVVFQRVHEGGRYTISVRRREGEAMLERSVGEYGGTIEEIGTSDVHGGGDRAVFLVGASSDSAGPRRDLVIVCPRQYGMISLSLVPSKNGGPPEEIPSSEYARPRFSVEQSFLERIKSAYGAGRAPGHRDAGVGADAGGAGSEFADWVRDNGGLRDGPMTIRRFPGPPEGFGPTTARAAIGAVTYTAHRGFGVIGFDTGTRDHFVVFHPADRDAFPTMLAVSGPWLVIGTHGEGLAFVDTRTFRLKRVRRGAETDTVRTLEVESGGMRVNGATLVPLPSE
jgi:hypothetical protein